MSDLKQKNNLKSILKSPGIAGLWSMLRGYRVVYLAAVLSIAVSAIARTLLKDPRILILDDATSSVDSETESLIQAALGRLMEGRTSFVIAHRVQTVIRADRILVLEGGRIIQTGTHDELLKVDGFYRKIFDLQFDELSREE